MNSFLRRLAGLITHGKDRSLDEDLRVIRGIAASPGTVTGRAKVGGGFRRRERPTETPTLQPGEVLVCEVALWGWRPLFSTATAVVTDSGGILSIAAIIARETGIPGPT
jgi:pyruvate,water dikinase